ncbi:MAG: acetyl-CoA carboxylase biotin carboxyl carrier protein [Candidatus Gastranaerophilaceae bacterium]|jgi:acetyl-CoA carboxylase biotin carboxyl carrier protein|nr:acetyl-CoA carboxylase biotin carboxyl carrier protein [Christensenellales bacterium]
MNIKTIRELAKILKDTNLTALELVEGETRIRLERSPNTQPPMQTDTAINGSIQAGRQEPYTIPGGDGDPGMDFNDVYAVASPMVGVFYAAPAPGKEPYVRTGSRVKKGDILCIIEAMKLMNEITAERDGEIVDICANDGDVVEFGQTLFKIY